LLDTLTERTILCFLQNCHATIPNNTEKTFIYSETICPLSLDTAATHSTSVSFLPRVSEKPVAAKKGIAPTGTIS